MTDLTVLMNTSEGFEDGWGPFFHLFARYLPACPYPIVLNTESKNAHIESLSFHQARVALAAPQRFTSGERLARCVDDLPRPYVLYLREDFFLESPVQQHYFEAFLGEMRCGCAGPIGSQRTEFNVHKFLSVALLLELVCPVLEAQAISYDDERGDVHETVCLDHGQIEDTFGFRYSCGIVEMIRRH
jgi:hypothetical protein